MKKLIFLPLFALFCAINSLSAKTNYYESNLLDSLQSGDKVAVLMVHFGTTHPDTQDKTIDALNTLVRVKYPQFEHREAWTSRIIIRKMAGRNEQILNPIEALQQLANEGFTHVIVQSSNIIEGIEMESLRRDVLSMQDHFKDIRIGKPLLYNTSDYETVVMALRKYQPKGSSLLLVGHGTYTAATAQYAMVQYVTDVLGYSDMHIGTVEGYPDFETAAARLKRKKVVLMPFMFVAGEHAKKDIDGEWREELSSRGHDVSTLQMGLGEIAEIQNLYLEHLDFAMKNQMYDIIEKKAKYAGSSK